MKKEIAVISALSAILCLPLAVSAEVLKPGVTFQSDADYVAEGQLIDVQADDIRVVDDMRHHLRGHVKPLPTAFFLKGLRNVTLDFRGATLLLRGKIQPFLIDCCTNVQIRNVTVKYARSPFTEGEVVESSIRRLVLRVDKGIFPYDVKDGNCIFRGDTWATPSSAVKSSFLQFFDGTTRRGAGLMLAVIGKDAKIDESEPWAKSTVRLLPSERDGVLALEADRDCQVFARAKPGCHAVFGHEDRSLSNCMIVDSRDVTLSGYRILNGQGMGVFSFHTHNITLDRFRIECDGASPGFIGNSADGIHAFCTSGDYVIRDSVVEGTIDDTLNIHSSFFTVKSAAGRRIVADTRREPISATPVFEPGDRIRVTRGSTLEATAEYEIVSTEPLDKNTVAFVVNRPVANHAAGDAIENLSSQCRIRISRSRFGRVNSHMRLQTRGEVLIEDCELDLPVLMTGDMNFWYESSPCDSVTFRNVAFKGGRGQLRAVPEFCDTEAMPHYHGHVKFENCTFEADTPVDAKYVRSITLDGCRNAQGKKMTVTATNCGTVVAPGCEIRRVTLPHRERLGVSY